MRIIIKDFEKGKEKKILESDYSYLENQTSQEGIPSLFISTKEGFEIHFEFDGKSDVDEFLKDLNEFREEI